MNATQLSIKLYNDKITLNRYRLPRPVFQRFDERHKMEIATGEIIPYGHEDMLRMLRNYVSSLARTRKNIKELSDKNSFRYFLTVTFNGQYVDRASAEKAHCAFKNVIKRLKYVYGGMEYIAVSEFHADLENIHYHVLCNFDTPPRLKFKGYSKKGHNAIYSIQDDFKKYDCFLTVEKITGENPIAYLLKYITKDSAQPLKRRYSSSHGLIRSRLIERKELHERDFDYLSYFARKNGFFIKHRFEHSVTLQRDHTRPRACAGRVDLIIIDTKDETPEEFFYRFLYKWERDKKIIKKFYRWDNGKR